MQSMEGSIQYKLNRQCIKSLSFFFFLFILSQSNKFLPDFDYEDSAKPIFLTFLPEYTIDST